NSNHAVLALGHDEIYHCIKSRPSRLLVYRRLRQPRAMIGKRPMSTKQDLFGQDREHEIGTVLLDCDEITWPKLNHGMLTPGNVRIATISPDFPPNLSCTQCGQQGNQHRAILLQRSPR